MNYKLTLQYDGTDFHGWQIQDQLRTVQGELTAALSLLEGRGVQVHGSGRTDAGVHAEAQVANVVMDRDITCDKLRAAINGNVGRDLRVMEVEEAAESFHARYSALEKTYLYRVLNGPIVSPFWLRYAHHDARKLDLNRQRELSALFLGEHDWTAFSAAQADVEDRTRTITRLEIAQRYDDLAQSSIIEIKVSANGFLRYMVRSIAGALLAVGRGELGHQELIDAIEKGIRPKMAATAPARGLTLLSVRYE